MTWPLPPFATDWANTTPQIDAHPAVHNAIGDALNELGDRTCTVLTGTYTPALGIIAIGTGGSALNIARYTFIGPAASGSRGILFMSGRIVFGTTGATFPGAGGEVIALPAALVLDEAPSYALTPIGRATYGIGSNYAGAIWWNTATTVRPVSETVSGTNLIFGDLTAAIPGTWVAGSTISYAYTCGAILQ